MTAVGPLLVSSIGLGVAAIGLLGVAAPGRLRRLLSERRSLTGLPATIALRLAFGLVFVLVAADCRWPLLVRSVGFIELTAAAVLLGVGRRRLASFVDWWLASPPSFVRGWCLAATALGGALAYAGA